MARRACSLQLGYVILCDIPIRIKVNTFVLSDDISDRLLQYPERARNLVKVGEKGRVVCRKVIHSVIVDKEI